MLPLMRAVDDRAKDSSGNGGGGRKGRLRGRVLNFKKSVLSFKTFHDSARCYGLNN